MNPLRFASLPGVGRTLVCCLTIAGTPAMAQEAIHSDAATLASPGVFVLRQQVRYTSFGNDPTGLDRAVEDVRLWTSMSLGLAPQTAVTVSVPLVYRETGSSDPGRSGSDFGSDDLRISGKWRVWQHDFGPIDTARVALIGGLELPTGQSPFGGNGTAVFAGPVFTYIAGRHGFNASALWRQNFDGETFPLFPGRGEADTLFYDVSYLYRVSPPAYTADTRGAWYAMVEANGSYETNGDHELLLSPGVMYEASNLALELALRLPAYQSLEARPESRVGVTVGVRWLF